MKANADVNGARKYFAAGHAVLACGGVVQSGRPMKQERYCASSYHPVMRVPSCDAGTKGEEDNKTMGKHRRLCRTLSL